MNTQALDAFRAHAAQDRPREACGLLVAIGRKQEYVACRNISDAPTERFELDPSDYVAASSRGTVIAVCHSHPRGSAKPSLADRSACEASGLPYYILSGSGEDLQRIQPDRYLAPLLGRPFVHGIHDCYTIIRDYYERELSIALPDFEREDEWWVHGQNLYLDNFSTAGFVQVDDLRVHDVILMELRSRRNVPNHAAVYIEEDKILHHLHGQLSSRVAYGGFWFKHTTRRLRHRQLL